MSEIKVTKAMTEVLKGWGWQFLDRLKPWPSRSWYKYENDMLVATGVGPIWDQDVEAALQATMPAGVVVVDAEAALGLVETELSDPVVDLLEGMGWLWCRNRSGGNEWEKFTAHGTSVAHQDDTAWWNDVKEAKLLAGKSKPEAVPGVEVWEVTPELRQVLALSKGIILQQKWVRVDDGRPEWRKVPYVDMSGVEIV